VPRPAGNHPLSLAELADLIGPPVQGDPSTTVTGAALASGDVRPGDLYAALPGARTHGARYAADAADRGATAVLTDPTGVDLARATGLPVCVVDDPREVLGGVASRVHGSPSEQLTVLGITGTNGKTTTSYLVEAGLAAAGWTSGLIGTVQTRTRGRGADGTPVTTELPSVRTTPEATDLHALLAGMVGSGVRAVVMEVSSHALVMGRVNGVRFAAAGFTNLSRDHLDFHGDVESYFQAKALLFDGRAAVEVVDVDDPAGRRLVKPGTVTVSTRAPEAADWWATDVAPVPTGGSAFTLHGRRTELAGAAAAARRLQRRQRGARRRAAGRRRGAGRGRGGRARRHRGARPDGAGGRRAAVRRRGRLRAHPRRGADRSRGAAVGDGRQAADRARVWR
jgi:UDP-N-acetylmuramoyl-L-alanyl-D-glutamate--2,6-diaminopimelate ligase